jgi:hypothetical protein
MPFLRTLIPHPLNSDPDCPLRSQAGQRIEATTLGEAVAAADEIFQTRIVPHDPPKWFRVYGIPDFGEQFILVDIHVMRGAEDLCPRQDLAFPLLDSDIVRIGAIAC